MKILVPTAREVAPAGPLDTFQRTPARAETAFGADLGAAQAGAGRALGAVADALSQGLVRRQAEHNETVVNDTYASHFSPALRQTYQSYYALQGRDAVDRLPEFEKALQDVRAKSREGMTNPDQQRIFDQLSMRRIDSELEGMHRYADQQNKAWQAHTSDATLKTALDDAADKWNDEDAFGTALGGGLAEIDRYATRTGQSAEVTRARADEFVSKAWSARIQSAAVRDPVAAEALYADNKGSIAAGERPQMEHSLRAAALPVRAKREALDIIGADVPAGTTPSATALRAHQGKWMAEAERRADKTYPDDPIYRDLLQSQVASYVTRIAGAEEALARNARNTVLSVAMTPSADGRPPSDINTVLTTPALRDAWMRMEAPEQLGVLSVLKANSNPPQTAAAMARYHEMRGMAVNVPAEFSARLKKDFGELAQLLPHEQMLQLINQDTAIAKADAKLLNQAAEASRIARVTNGLLQQAGFKTPKSDGTFGKGAGDDDQNAYQNYVSRMLDKAEDYAVTHKRKPSDIELREMSQQLLVEGYEAGTGMTWFGYPMFRTKRHAFEADANFAVPAPPDEIPKIRAAYIKTFQREPNPEEIDRWYAARLQQGKK